MDNERLDWILMKAQEAHSLTVWEHAFINDILKRRERQGENIVISERQEEILESIAEKG